MITISEFIEIDESNWDRREIFEGYKNVSFCVTTNIDITNYMQYRHSIKFYPFMNYIVAKVINSDICYRMALREGKVGYYALMHPLYTLLRSNNLFTHKYTLYNEDFVTFYHDFLRDKAIGEASNDLYADGCRPRGTFSTSTLPHTSFTSLSLSYCIDDLDTFSPFSTFGKYFEHDGRWYCPVSTQFFHGMNDGYHAERYIQLIQEAIDDFYVDIAEL